MATGGAVSKNCDACILDLCYKRNVILETYDTTGQFAVDMSLKILYMHIKNFLDITAAINLKKNVYTAVDLTSNITKKCYGRAVDQKTHDVYISGRHDIYIFNPIRKSIERMNFPDKHVRELQFQGRLYYTKPEGLNIYEDGTIKIIKPLQDFDIHEFIIDKREDLYFHTLSGFSIYRIRKGSNRTTLFLDELFSLATDKLGNAYFLRPHTRKLYRLNYHTDNLVEVGTFSHGVPFRFVFDNQMNVVYKDLKTKKLYYLKVTTRRCNRRTLDIKFEEEPNSQKNIVFID